MFCVIEGIDWCGKSTIGKRLAAKINADYREFPDRSTVTGKIIGDWLKNGLKLLCPQRDAVILQSLLTVNKLEAQPWLGTRIRASANVVFSRWTPSALAYGAADGCSRDWLEIIHSEIFLPDLCILLDVPVMTALARKTTTENYELPTRLARARENYQQIWLERRAAGAGNWVVVDGERPVEDVFAEVLDWYEARRVRNLETL